VRENAGKLVSRPENTAMLVIDMQNDFVIPGAPVAAPGALDLVPSIAGLAAKARAKGLKVVYTQEMHRADGSDFGIELEFEPPHCLEGTPGLDIVDGLAPGPEDRVIRGKRRYDGFLGTDLEFVLRGANVENLIVTGVCTDVCVISTVQHARNLDYRCFVASDCVAGTSRERHDAALVCMEYVFAHVGTSDEIVEVFAL
jgi:nicotinamidase-related amidase